MAFVDKFLKPEKAAYEKDCKKFYFFDSKNLLENVEVCGKFLDESNKQIEFSGYIFEKQIKLTETTFFIDSKLNVYTIDKQSVSKQAITVDLKNKTEAYEVTRCNYFSKKLEIRDI